MSIKDTLVIFDVSPFVYVGQHVTDVYASRLLGMPVKGVYYLNKHLAHALSLGHHVVLCFDSKSFRKKIDKNYKEHRLPNPEIYLQLDFIYEYMNKIGVVCHKENGYEADDLIYNVVEANKSRYRNILVYGVDYDLTHNISSNVSFKSISSQVNSVDCKNFKDAIVKNETIVYNTITAYKVFMGDKSDGIGVFKSTLDKGPTGKQLYDLYIKAMQVACGLNPEIIKTRKALEIFLNKIGKNLSEDDLKTLKIRMDLFFPATVEGIDFSETSGRHNINLPSLCKYLSNLNDNRSLKHLNMKSCGFEESIRSDIKKRANDLNTGAYAVDKSISNSPCVRMNSSSLFIGEF